MRWLLSIFLLAAVYATVATSAHVAPTVKTGMTAIDEVIHRFTKTDTLTVITQNPSSTSTKTQTITFTIRETIYTSINDIAASTESITPVSSASTWSLDSTLWFPFESLTTSQNYSSEKPTSTSQTISRIALTSGPMLTASSVSRAGSSGPSAASTYAATSQDASAMPALSSSPRKSSGTKIGIVAGVSAGVAVLLCAIFGVCVYRCKRKKPSTSRANGDEEAGQTQPDRRTSVMSVYASDPTAYLSPLEMRDLERRHKNEQECSARVELAGDSVPNQSEEIYELEDTSWQPPVTAAMARPNPSFRWRTSHLGSPGDIFAAVAPSNLPPLRLRCPSSNGKLNGPSAEFTPGDDAAFTVRKLVRPEIGNGVSDSAEASQSIQTSRANMPASEVGDLNDGSAEVTHPVETVRRSLSTREEPGVSGGSAEVVGSLRDDRDTQPSQIGAGVTDTAINFFRPSRSNALGLRSREEIRALHQQYHVVYDYGDFPDDES